MKLHAVWISVCVVGLAGCSLWKSTRSVDGGPEAAPVRSENIHTVGEEPPPVVEAPREKRRTSLQEARKTLDDARAGREPSGAERMAAAGSDSVLAAASTPSLTPRSDPNLAPMAGRVGIMSLLDNNLRHVHASPPFGGHEQSYNVQYDFQGYVLEELRKALLTQTPYQPVIVASTGALRQSSAIWQKSWNGKSFAPTFQREFDGIMEQNRLVMLIIVSYTTLEDGLLVGGQELTGSGLYTRTVLGSTSSAVFSTLQFHRVAGKPGRLILPIAPSDDRSIGDLPNVKLPADLDDLPPRYLVPVYEPLRTIVANKISGFVRLPRKLGF
ncbi:MAG: hypothetical protein ACT4QA_15880 [Panacagrimonas sp.]